MNNYRTPFLRVKLASAEVEFLQIQTVEIIEKTAEKTFVIFFVVVNTAEEVGAISLAFNTKYFNECLRKRDKKISYTYIF